MALNKLGPPCPNCGSHITRVVTTARDGHNSFYRRRHCEFCDHRFTTAQPAEIVAPSLVFAWSRQKLMNINWRHPSVLNKMRELINPQRP